MQVSGSYLIEAPREQVWPLIFDPNALVALVPGCERLEQVAPDEYRGQMRVGVAAVGGTYETLVKVLEQDPPHRCRLEGEISGPTGTIRGQASFTLKEVGNGTLIEYETTATITGALATLDSRFVEGVVRALLNLGLARLGQQARSQAAQP